MRLTTTTYPCSQNACIPDPFFCVWFIAVVVTISPLKLGIAIWPLPLAQFFNSISSHRRQPWQNFWGMLVLTTKYSFLL